MRGWGGASLFLSITSVFTIGALLYDKKFKLNKKKMIPRVRIFFNPTELECG